MEGSTLERAAHPLGELAAFISGTRIGSAVSFTKVYDRGADFGPLPVAYYGAADEALNIVQGHWRLLEPDPLRGRFIMRRVSANPAFALQTAREVRPMAGVRARRRRR